MSAYPEQKSQNEHAAAWILKSLHSNTAWFDEIRLAGRKNFERKYHFIPLVDISLVSEVFDISVLKDACYLLKENADIEIWGDDFEPFGMLVQITDKGIDSYQGAYYESGETSLAKKGLKAATTLVILAAIIIGVKSFISLRHDKNVVPTYNKSKAADSNPKATAYLHNGAADE
jgi:hypothetical protein